MSAPWPEPLSESRDLERDAMGWRRSAGALAAFIDTHLVNRRDVWGAYKPLEHRVGGEQHTYTAPAKARRGSAQLDRSRIARHLCAESQGHIIGLHSTSNDDTSRWAGFDFDAHGEQPAEYLNALQNAAVDIIERLAEYGAAPLLEDSNGRGGLHVWVYFDAPVPACDVFAWIDFLADRARLVNGVAIETYPKQSSARGAFGNWLRLPGRHHTKAHWSRVARPGAPWGAGIDAVNTLLAWPATPASVVPPASVWPLSSVGRVSDDDAPIALPTERAPKIRRYLERLAHGSAGSGRSDRLFSLARFLRHGMHCTDHEALGVMRAWNTGNAPPLDDKKVVDTWHNAGVYNAQPYHLRAGGSRAA